MKAMTMRLSAVIAGALAIVAIPACAWEVIRLSSDPVPATSTEVREDGPFGTIVLNVSDATLTPYVAEKPNGTAVIVAPGGGFRFLTLQAEGVDVARALAAHGVTVFLLKYRTVETPVDDRQHWREFFVFMAQASARGGELNLDAAAARDGK